MAEPLAGGSEASRARPPAPPAVKICGVTRARDARVAESLGASYVGMILSGGFDRSVTPHAGAGITSGLEIETVAVLVDEPVETAVHIAETVGVAVLQLHGNEPEGLVAELRSAGDWLVWKALRLRVVDDLERGIERYGTYVDGFLLEGWHPSKVGGSGESFAWDEFATALDRFPEGVDLIAAGGLKHENVREAIEQLRPSVVDVSSGVELEVGIKDRSLVEAFVTKVRGDVG